MKYITPLILSITFALTAFSADKKVPKVAAKGWCFIAPDGGKKWYAKKSCRSRKKSTNVKYLTLEDAKNLVRTKNGSMAATSAGVNIRKRSDAI